MFHHPVGPRDFEVTGQLGKGGFGSVFQVVHRKQTFAMKLLEKEKHSSAKMRKSAMVERDILANVCHPYIVRLHYAFQTERYLALVMDYCAGGSAEQLLKKDGRLSLELSRHYISQVLLVLEHLHGLGLLYRDLKSGNVLIDAEGHAVLVDFGLSKEDSHGGSFVGTTALIAPEVIFREGHDRRIDLYGLGALLYTFLSGETPFYAVERQRTWKGILSDTLEMPANATEDAAALITQLMDRYPEKRLGSCSTEDVRTHPFFSGVDFEALLKRSVPAPEGAPCVRRPSVEKRTKTHLRRCDIFADAECEGSRLKQCFCAGRGRTAPADSNAWTSWDFDGHKEDSDGKFAWQKGKLQTLFKQVLA
jgi:serine/threonine protein kinase